MELDFDKEIDALLRQTVKSDAAFANGNPQTAHLDADEISAFAENTLPEKAKQRLTAHFADCDSCRKNLSELILLNGENEVETVEEEKTAVIAPAIAPWYRKLFVFPNLAYTMGALVLAFTGLTAFIVLQNFSGMNADVASSNTNSIDRASAPIQSETMSFNANNATSDTATAANSNSAANLSPQGSPEVLSNSTATQSKSEDEAETPTDLKQTNQPRSETDLDRESQKGNKPDDAAINKPENKPVQGRPQISADAPTIAESQTAPPPAPVPEERKAAAKRNNNEIFVKRSGGEKPKEDVQKTEAAKGASLSESRQISGKTFNQKDGVWYDSAYRNQTTTNVRRGTNEYRNLDSGLRSIGNQLDGVVVVVWKTKAYRIQ